MNRGNIDRGMRRKGRDGFAGKQINNKQNDSRTTLEGEAALLEGGERRWEERRGRGGGGLYTLHRLTGDG